MGGKLKFVKRGGLPSATIPKTDLAAHEEGSSVPDPLGVSRVQDLELPLELSVLYINPGADYQQGVQISKRQTSSGVNTISVSLPIVFSDEKAKKVADTLHYLAWLERTTYTLVLSRKWSRLEPTDIIVVQYNGIEIPMRITGKTETGSGTISLECVAEDASVYSQSGLGAGPVKVPTQTIYVPVQTMAIFLDIPLLRDEDTGPGMYFAAGGYRTGWRGCTVYKSSDNGATYNPIFTETDEAIIGYASTALGDFTGGNIFDELNSVIVTIYSGTLSSTTELAVLNGANTAVIGSEIIQFKTAELIAENTYKLSGLLRGRKGTEEQIKVHSIGDLFVLASLNTWQRIPMSTAEINLPRLYKPVSIGASISQTVAIPKTCTAMGLECYSPVQVSGSRNVSEDIIISWVRRNRLSGEWRDYVDVPMSESTESYEIDIYSDSTFTTVKRTITATTTSATYTTAQQITDFGLIQRKLYIKVYQKSAFTGRGIPAQASLTIPRLPISATQWRIYVTNWNPESDSIIIYEMEMRGAVDGADLCIGGTASASHAYSSSADYAFDDNDATYWRSYLYTLPVWLQYTFSSPVAIKQLKIRSGVSGGAPNAWKLEYYNGSAWVAVYEETNDVPNGSNTKYYTVQD